MLVILKKKETKRTDFKTLSSLTEVQPTETPPCGCAEPQQRQVNKGNFLI